jgi:CBS domain containing-hemolysin-like protein
MALELLILLICLFLSAFFSATETAFTSLSRLKVSHMVERRLPGARLVKKLKEDPAKLLSTVLIGNNIVNIGASVLATTIMLRTTETMGWGGIGVAAGIATGIMTFFILVFGEITPKTVAIRHAEFIALFCAWPIYIISIIITPLAAFLAFFSTPFIYLFGGRIPEGGPFVTAEEIKLLIAAGAKEGVIERGEKEMISSIFEFGETNVSEVMTPRPDIKAVEDSSPIEEVLKLIAETGHSRIPVYEGNLDNITGVVYAKDLLNCSHEDPLKDYMRAALFIPESKRVDDLLHQMQAARTHLAVVVDEFGVTSGIVTLEDLVEEIVGEIHDEFERMEKNIEKLDENTYLVDGKLLVADLNRELKLNLPEEEYDTIAGLVFGQLGKVPSVGDVVKYDNLEISVEKVLKRRVLRVKITRLPRRIDDNIVGG